MLSRYRQRFLFRGMFVLLLALTLLLVLVLLNEEKARSIAGYQQGLHKTFAELMARLRHPTGHLILLNPQRDGQNMLPLRPVLLPFAGLDFSNYHLARQAVELSGCSLQYANGATLCAAVGQSPYVGGFIYLVGSLISPRLVGRRIGYRDVSDAHRLHITLDAQDEHVDWLAPFEADSGAAGRGNDNVPGAVAGRLPGYATDSWQLPLRGQSDRDFRGWLWQEGGCVDTAAPALCGRRTFYALRIPVDSFRSRIFQPSGPQWPPENLQQYRLRVHVLGPDGPLFDSDDVSAQPPPVLQDLMLSLSPGEKVLIRQVDGAGRGADREFAAEAMPLRQSSPWLRWLVSRLPGSNPTQEIRLSDTVSTPAGQYQVTLLNHMQGVGQHLEDVAQRFGWYMLVIWFSILFVWAVIETGLMRPVVRLTRRAQQVTSHIQSGRTNSDEHAADFRDMCGNDEVGVLATSLEDLLGRVRDDMRREQIRMRQEQDMWHAVGHEIMSPLQLLMVLHQEAEDLSHRYVQRMQQAIQVLYGHASPGEAFQSVHLRLDAVELNTFLRTLADNAPFAGMDHVVFQALDTPLVVRADEFSLEDVITHILRNADRYRLPGSAIRLWLEQNGEMAEIWIHNQGTPIDGELLPRIFDYGVSGPDEEGSSHRGQGLFVANSYMAKMGGTIRATAAEDGTVFILALHRE